MSCGVRYNFSIVTTPTSAEVLHDDPELKGTPRDAEEAGAADVRRADPGIALPENTPQGRTRRGS